MKRIITAICLLVATVAQAQTHSCCGSTSTQTFAMLGNDKAFKASHLNPEPFVFATENGKMITFKTADRTTGTAFAVMAEKPTEHYILMVHEWWGLNDYIKQEAEQLQKELGNVNILAIDLYDGKVATTADEAGKLMGGVKEERAKAIINGAIAFVGIKAKIYTIGWCFGGGWSLQATLLTGKQAEACVMYYGMPEKDLTKLKTLNADVLGIFATKDAWISPKVVADFEADMNKADKKLMVKNFDADHAFANPSNPKFNKEYAAEAHKVAVAFIKSHLK